MKKRSFLLFFVALVPIALSSCRFTPLSSSSSSAPSLTTSSLTSSVEASSATSSSSLTSSTTSVSYITSSIIRAQPITASGTSTPLYALYNDNGTYRGANVKTLSKGSYYVSYAEVAAYWVAFGEMPANYYCADGDSSSGYMNSKNAAYAKYGEAARLWFTYHRTDGYMNQVPAYFTYQDNYYVTYYEMDISSSWSSYYSGRGALRVMGMPYGLKQYEEPCRVAFYTSDHYDTFKEYLNYRDGWGSSFASRSDYIEPTTIPYAIA
jgi:hypothetical protein